MSEAMLTVKAHRGVIEFEAGCRINSRTGRAAIDLKRIIAAEETDPKQWGWEHATWVDLGRGDSRILNIALDDLLELWRAALRWL